MEAALKGAEQIGFTIISLTVSLIAVLIPLLFMGDVVGRLFRRVCGDAGGDDCVLGCGFADADADDVLANFEAHAGSQQGWFFKSFESACFENIIAFYGRTLKFVLGSRRSRCWWRGDAGLLTVLLYIDHPQGIFPDAGYGRDSGHFAGAAVDFVCGDEQKQQEMAKVVLEDPAVAEPVVVHRRGWHQHHAQQRAHVRST
jgi:multidrug efflux pump